MKEEKDRVAPTENAGRSIAVGGLLQQGAASVTTQPKLRPPEDGMQSRTRNVFSAEAAEAASFCRAGGCRDSCEQDKWPGEMGIVNSE